MRCLRGIRQRGFQDMLSSMLVEAELSGIIRLIAIAVCSLGGEEK